MLPEATLSGDGLDDIIMTLKRHQTKEYVSFRFELNQWVCIAFFADARLKYVSTLYTLVPITALRLDSTVFLSLADIGEARWNFGMIERLKDFQVKMRLPRVR